MKTLFTTVKYEDYIFEIEYVYIPAIPGKLTGPPEDCYPDEPGEIEFISVCLAGNPLNLYNIMSGPVLEEIEEEILERHQAGELE